MSDSYYSQNSTLGDFLSAISGVAMHPRGVKECMYERTVQIDRSNKKLECFVQWPYFLAHIDPSKKESYFFEDLEFSKQRGQ